MSLVIYALAALPSFSALASGTLGRVLGAFRVRRYRDRLQVLPCTDTIPQRKSYDAISARGQMDELSSTSTISLRVCATNGVTDHPFRSLPDALENALLGLPSLRAHRTTPRLNVIHLILGVFWDPFSRTTGLSQGKT